MAWGTRRPNRFQNLIIEGIHARILRGIFRKAARGVLIASGPDYDIEINGVRLRCRLGDNATDHAILEYGPDAYRLGLTRVLSMLKPDDIFIDAGANCGVFTVFGAKAVGRYGRVIAIEPQSEMLARLRFNIEANELQNVTVIPVAVGDVTRIQPMRTKRHNLGASALTDTSGDTFVDVQTLASIVTNAAISCIDVLKIDIEGYEDRAILPYIATAPKAMWPKHIFMEVGQSGGWQDDCLAGLLRAGYRQIWTDGHDGHLTLST